MARQWDYDGNIRRWDEFGVLPEPIKTMVDFVASKVKKRSVSLVGCGDGLLAAGLADKGIPVYSYVKPLGVVPQEVLVYEQMVPAYQAPKRPRATGAYEVREVDPAGKEIFDFLGPDTVLVGRKTIQRCYSAEWMKRLSESGLELLISEAFQGGEQLFDSPEVESAFLKRHNWVAKVSSGRFVWATRGKDSVSESDED
jgi:hypothetical protein